jgi:hypothetical protein
VPICYRPANASDATSVAHLHAVSWRRNYRGAYSDDFLDGDVLADRLSIWNLGQAFYEAFGGEAAERATVTSPGGVAGRLHGSPAKL